MPIVEVPEPDALVDAGTDYLCVATDLAVEVADGEDSLRHDMGLDFRSAHDRDLLKSYGALSRRKLASAASLLHAGIELVLKGRIAAISPFLLLESRSLVKAGGAKSYAFDDLRTINAVDLVSTACAIGALDDEPQFRGFFDEIRTRRNALMHIASEKHHPDWRQVLRDVSEAGYHLFGTKNWIRAYRAYQTRPPWGYLDEHGVISQFVLRAVDYMLQAAGPARCERLFGVKWRRRRYQCPTCLDADMPSMIPLAWIEGPRRAQILRCLACESENQFVRQRCETAGCNGRLQANDGQCLTCGEWQ